MQQYNTNATIQYYMQQYNTNATIQYYMQQYNTNATIQYYMQQYNTACNNTILMQQYNTTCNNTILMQQYNTTCNNTILKSTVLFRICLHYFRRLSTRTCYGPQGIVIREQESHAVLFDTALMMILDMQYWHLLSDDCLTHAVLLHTCFLMMILHM